MLYSFLFSTLHMPYVRIGLNAFFALIAGCIISLSYIKNSKKEYFFSWVLILLPVFISLIYTLFNCNYASSFLILAFLILVLQNSEEDSIEKVYIIFAALSGSEIGKSLYVLNGIVTATVSLLLYILQKRKGKVKITVNPEKQILMLCIAFVICTAAVCQIPPLHSWLKEKFRQHVTFNFTVIKNLPSDNGLPRLIINTKDKAFIVSKDYWKQADFIIQLNGETVRTGELELKGHGNSTWEMPKKPYTIKLPYEEDFLTLKKDSKWLLINSYPDKTLSRVWFAFTLGSSIYKNLVWTPQCYDVELVMNGVYLGVYQFSEIIKIKNDRVNIQSITDVKNLDEGGYILEIGREKNLHFETKHGVKISLKDPDKVKNPAFEHIKKQVQNFEDALYADNFTDKTDGWRKYMDEKSLIDWYLINEFTKNPDARFIASVIFYYDPADKLFHFGPIWDFDISSGNYDHKDCQYAEGFHIKTAVWFSRLFEDETFKKAVVSRWNETREQLIKVVHTQIQLHADYLEQAQQWNFKAWNIMNQNVWPNYVVMGTYQGEVDYLIDWLSERYVWLDKAFNNGDF